MKFIFYATLFSLFIVLYNGSYAQSPLVFVENKGQWKEDFAYKGESALTDFYLEQNGYTFLLSAADNAHKIDEAKHHNNGDITLHYHAYKMKWVNAKTPIITSSKPEPYIVNYYLGKNPEQWKSNIHPVRVVDYNEIYEGINVHITASNENLKYDYIVAPKSDPKQIQMLYEGADQLELKKGRLIIKTSITDIVEDKPYAFQYINGEKKEVSCNYVMLGNNVVGFEFPEGYNENYELTIDPEIIFASLTGSIPDNWGFTATYDSEGNLYAGGIVNGNSYPTTTGAFQTTFAGGTAGTSMPCDIGITKFNATGTDLLYSTYIGGSLNDYPHSLVVDATNNLYISGKTISNDFPVTATAYDTSHNGQFDIYVAKLNATGTSLLGSTYIGGSSNDGLNIDDAFDADHFSIKYNYGDNARSEILLDNSNNVFVASASRSSNFPVTATAAKSTMSDSQDGVLIKLNTNLTNLVYSSYIGGSSNDAAYCLTFDSDKNNIYVGGGTQSSNFMSGSIGGLWSSNQGGLSDGFILKFQNSGSYNLLNGTYIGTNAYDQVFGLQSDTDDEIYAMGQTMGSFPVTSGVYSNANSRHFVIKLSNDLSTNIFSTVWGNGAATTPNISPVAFLVDTCEHIYISGWGGSITGSSISGLPISTDALQSSTDGNDFYFIVLKNDATSLLYGSYFGSVGKSEHVDGGTSRFDPFGIVYQAMCASCGPGSSAFPASPGAWASTKGSGSTNCNLGTLKMAFNLGGVVAEAIPEPSSSGCAPFTVNFNNESTNATDYIWDFGDGSATSTEENPTHTYTATGVYNVRLVATNEKGCTTEDTAYITITVTDNNLNPDFNYQVLDSCEDFTVQFTNTSTSYSPTPFTTSTFTWLFGDGTNYSGVTPPIHSYPGPGTYTVTLIMNDPNACNTPDSIVKEITITNGNVIADFEAADTCVSNNTVTFTNLSNNAVNYTWFFGDGSTGSGATPTHGYAASGSYTVTLIAGNPNACNFFDTVTKTINIFPKPTANFYSTPLIPEVNMPTNFVNTSENANRYLWNFGDSTTSTETSPSHQYLRSGSYYVCLTAFNEYNCTDTICKPVTAEVEPLIDLPTAFTPNGDGNNDLLIPRGFAVETVSFQVYNRWGELVFESDDILNGWDGTYKGKEQPMETYAYMLSATFFDGSTAKKQGNVTLIR